MLRRDNNREIFKITNESITWLKAIIVLSLLFVIEYPIWVKLNFHHRPNKFAIGNSIAFLIFLFSCYMIISLVFKKKYKLAMLFFTHLIMIYFIDITTLNEGRKRYADTKYQVWEFEKEGHIYNLKLEKENNFFAIYNEKTKEEISVGYLHGEKLLSGGYKIENGTVKFRNQTNNISINSNSIIGFPEKLDSIKLNKIYW